MIICSQELHLNQLYLHMNEILKNETKYLNSQQSKDKIKWPCNLREFM